MELFSVQIQTALKIQQYIYHFMTAEDNIWKWNWIKKACKLPFVNVSILPALIVKRWQVIRNLFCLKYDNNTPAYTYVLQLWMILSQSQFRHSNWPKGWSLMKEETWFCWEQDNTTTKITYPSTKESRFQQLLLPGINMNVIHAKTCSTQSHISKLYASFYLLSDNLLAITELETTI